jgi:hypothetical protein
MASMLAQTVIITVITAAVIMASAVVIMSIMSITIGAARCAVSMGAGIAMGVGVVAGAGSVAGAAGGERTATGALAGVSRGLARPSRNMRTVGLSMDAECAATTILIGARHETQRALTVSGI